MRDAVEQLGEVAGEVGVPRVRVDEVARPDGRRHLQVGGEDAQHRVGAGETGVVLGVGDGAGPGRAEAVHVDVDEARQLPGQEVDVDAGAAVDLGRVLPREHPDPHGGRAYNCGPERPRWHARAR